MAWYHFGRECPYSKLTLCQERYCTNCNIYLTRNEKGEMSEIKAEANEVPEVYRAGLLGVPGLQTARKELV